VHELDIDPSLSRRSTLEILAEAGVTPAELPL
jgi:hypothetical protein